MLSFRALFVRYCSIHRRINLKSKDLLCSANKIVGRVDAIAVTGNKIIIEGWACNDEITVHHGRQNVSVVPAILRHDSKTGFEIALPYYGGPITLSAKGKTGPVKLPIARFMHIRDSVETVRLLGHFMWDGLTALPSLYRWLRAETASQKMEEKQRIKTALRLGLADKKRAPVITDKAFNMPQLIAEPAQKITIIIPVYNAFDVLRDCISRVFTHTDLPWHLIIVEDCSSDPRVRPYLQDLASGANHDAITLLLNSENLGFVVAANRGLTEAEKHGSAVVLLNSDALVPSNWASRIVAPFADPLVASVTPMSNDAEIFSAPFIVTATHLDLDAAQAMDDAAQNLLGGVTPIQVPTGVGFCLAMSPEWLRQVPRLDTAFGQGYGEEVDWCRKVLARGGRHVAQPSLFVEHRGGQSFGHEGKLERLAANNAIISRRYREYDEEVQDFIRADPLIAARMVLAMTWAQARQKKHLSVFVVHSMGGGAEHAGERQIQALLDADESAIVLRLGGQSRFNLALRNRLGDTLVAFNETSILDHIFGALSSCHYIYVCGVGDPDPTFIPKWLVERSQIGAASTVEVQFHDFFPVSPSYNLLDNAGVFQGVPIGGQNAYQSHNFKRAGQPEIVLADWQRAWAQVLYRAARIEVYSEASAKIIAEVWPKCATKIVVSHHAMLASIPEVQRTPKRRAEVIGILGNIGASKGAGVVADLAAYQRRNKGSRLVVIGNVDPQFSIVRPAIIHGNYRQNEISNLAKIYGIDCWLIPSIWPETFSFATHEALATGLPVWCFDLGGQADAVKSAIENGATGGVIPIAYANKDIADLHAILTGLK